MTISAIFVYSTDAGVGFGAEAWPLGEFKKKFLAFWSPGALTLNREADGILKQLREDGGVDFEDGWIRLFTDIGEGVAFIYEKAKNNHADYMHDRKQMIANKRRADEASKALIDLRATLLNALGDRADEVRAAIP